MGGEWSGRVGVGQGGCERRIEVFGKIKKKKDFFLGGRGGGSGWGRWGEGGVRVDVNEELKFLGKLKKKVRGGGRGGGVVGGGGGGRERGGGQGGCE